MGNSDFIFADRQTGIKYPTATALINEYIKQFSKAVSEATNTDVTFDLLDSQGFSSISKGSATIGITVSEDQGVLIFLSRIMKIPQHREMELFRLLLELNYTSTADSAFAIEKETGTICLRAQRSIKGLDYDEFEDMLHTVASVADSWDDKLLTDFAG
jgi:hypothetical protein